MTNLDELVIQIELHSVEGIKHYFSNGISPNIYFKGQPLINTMINMYNRTPRFKDCVKAFVDHGLKFYDTVLLSVLLDDFQALENHIKSKPGIVKEKHTLESTYTPLEDVALLHICAEYNHLHCARVLVAHGADVNEKAGTDEFGFGGQTPVFHTVNQNQHNSKEMLAYLLSESAELNLTLKGIIWGKGYEWETLIPAVNPISYAMMGLLPQMHRDELTISKVVMTLLKYQYGIDYSPGNVPCAYLKPAPK
ncbi:MAG: ankyrin repeat domain-containing protein [Ferruginibacter sp.]|nr:ankyrin repeat domain-containing protein [Ferruginibacter sp.]